MRKRGEAASAKRGYHHGNLKEALIAAACRLIAERGPAGFTLIEAARLAGVSAAAPYRHFRDREALLSAVAARGFALFAARLAQAWQEAEDDPARGFYAMGAAYLAFAQEEPGFYAAMFSAPGSAAEPEGGREGERAFATLESALARVSSKGGEAPGAEAARFLALQVWALSHGIATLAASGLIGGGEVAPQALLRSGVEALVAGRHAEGASAPAEDDARAASTS